MKLNCSNEILSDRLAIYIDLSDQGSWNLNTGFTSISLNEWDSAKSGNANLYDFGLTEFDNGRVNDLLASAVTTPDDTKLTLYRVGYNNATGGTFYDLYPITSVTGTSTTVGNYLNLNGGYLQGYFKLQDEEYEILPARYKDGITIETLINISGNSEGIFYMMGARAEDKYNPYFSGETEAVVTTTSVTLRTGNLGEAAVVRTSTTGFTGILTSKENNLNAYIDTEIKKQAFQMFEESTKIIPVEQERDNTFANAIAFLLEPDGKLGIKQITDTGVVKINRSKNTITETGWTLINVSFVPDKILTEEELLCEPRRKGILTVYLDGRRFWQLKDFDEYMFKDFNNHKEKTYGVPYSISWGGGSFGLKHSWHWDKNVVGIYSGQSASAITSGFTSQNATLVVDDCTTLTATTSGVTLTANINTFTVSDECEPPNITPITVFEMQHPTGASTHHEFHYIEYNTNIELFPNREYKFQADIKESGAFYATNGEIYLTFTESDNLEVISVKKYNSANPDAPYDWNQVNITVKTKTQETVITKVGLYIVANTQTDANIPYSVYIKEWKYGNLNDLVQDAAKDNLLIEQNFDSSFIGGIQKLRIYDYGFNSQEALHNAKAEKFSDPEYGLTTNGGGRIIYI